MRVLTKMKDGGPESRVTGYWLIELKSWFSIVLLRFDDGSREMYHTHAFNAYSWLLTGRLDEYVPIGGPTTYFPSATPIFTPRERMHKVVSRGRSWVLSFRGPWTDHWYEYDGRWYTRLTHGRQPA